MFSFFTKKHFLVDHLEGFIDIHNHILPGVDDGAKTVTESVELIKGFREFGVTNFICTPHIMENYYPNDSSTIIKSLNILQNELKMQGMENINISAAAEHMIDSGFKNLLDSDKIMPLAKHYILIEMSYLQPSLNFKDAVNAITTKGLYPILAHPERYTYYSNDLKIHRQIKSRGVLYQLNILSLSNYYGKEVNSCANKLLKENLVDFLATDVHNPKQLKHLTTIEINNKLLDIILPLIEKTVYNFY